MRGGFLLSLDEPAFEQASSTLGRLGAHVARDNTGQHVAQWRDESGRLFTLFERVPEVALAEVHEGPFFPQGGIELPDMSRVVGAPFECRWRDIVVRMFAAIAAGSDQPMWLLDGNGNVWDAAAVDPDRVVL